MRVTKEAIQATLKVVKVVADTIKELGQVPSGHLYSQLCGHLTLEQYRDIIDLLKRSNLVSESNHLLTWIETS